MRRWAINSAKLHPADGISHLCLPPLTSDHMLGLALIKENEVSATNIYYNRDYLCVVEKQT